MSAKMYIIFFAAVQENYVRRKLKTSIVNHSMIY